MSTHTKIPFAEEEVAPSKVPSLQATSSTDSEDSEDLLDPETSTGTKAPPPAIVIPPTRQLDMVARTGAVIAVASLCASSTQVDEGFVAKAKTVGVLGFAQFLVNYLQTNRLEVRCDRIEERCDRIEERCVRIESNQKESKIQSDRMESNQQEILLLLKEQRSA